jgi:short subunit dehydrogenase-like uncharacterized protein
LITLIYNKIYSIIFGGKDDANENTSSTSTEEVVDYEGMKKAIKFDVVIFGATGFTGKLCAQYLAKQYGYNKTLKWAIAGRRENALKEIRTELVKLDSSMENLPYIIANSDSFNSLAELCAQTKTVATTVGPFAKYGTRLVEVCAAMGTHYCDITGETDFVREMITLHENTCRRTGAKIVVHCGHDCVPWDLCVNELSNHFQNPNPNPNPNDSKDRLCSVRCYDVIRAAPSGGTLATVINAMER